MVSVFKDQTVQSQTQMVAKLEGKPVPQKSRLHAEEVSERKQDHFCLGSPWKASG